MKTTFFLVVLVTLFSQNGCIKAVEPTSSDIYVNYEIESVFQNDYVKLTLDDKILLESRVTTNYTINLAWSSGLQKLSRDSHILRFAVVEYGIQNDYSIDTANDTSTVLLRFDKSAKQISIQQIKEEFCAINHCAA